MPNLQAGTFLRLIGMDKENTRAALEVPILPVAISSTQQTQIGAVAAAIYGTGKLSDLQYIGYDVVVSLDAGANITTLRGNARKHWLLSYNMGSGLPPETFTIPIMDDADAGLVVAGTRNINAGATPWVNFFAALAASNISAPYTGSGIGSFTGGVSAAYKRVKPRERVRVLSQPFMESNTRLHVWGKDVGGNKEFAKIYISAFDLGTTLPGQIAALAAATFGAVPGTTVLPSLGVYLGMELVIRVDSGATGAGSGDVRAKWKNVSQTSAGELVRWSIPGASSITPGLIVPGTKTIANLTASQWTALVTALAGSTLGAPLSKTGTSAPLKGSTWQVRVQKAPREHIARS